MKPITKHYIELVVKKLMGLDLALDSAPAQDEEVWRTTTNKGEGENTHYKIDTTTGEITAGFGGKYNGETPSEAFGQNNPEKQERPAIGAKPKGTLTKKQQQLILNTVVNSPTPDPKHKNWVKGTIQSQGQQWNYALNTQTGQYRITDKGNNYALAKNGHGNYTHNAFGAAMLQEWKDQMLADWNIDVDKLNFQGTPKAPKQPAATTPPQTTQTPPVAPAQPSQTQTPNQPQTAPVQPPQPQQTANNGHWVAPGVSAREMAHMGANYPVPTAAQIAYINKNTGISANQIKPAKRKGWEEGIINYRHPKRGIIACPFEINRSTGEFFIKNDTKAYALAKNGKGDYAVDGACAAMADWLKNKYNLPTFTGKGNATVQPQAQPTPQATPAPQASAPTPAPQTPSAPQAQPQQPTAAQTMAQRIKSMQATIKPSSNASDDIQQKSTLGQAERVARIEALFDKQNPTRQEQNLQATILNNAGLLSDRKYQQYLGNPWKWDATMQNKARRMVSALKHGMQPRNTEADHKRIDGELAKLTSPAKINAWCKNVLAQNLDPNDYNTTRSSTEAVQKLSIALGLETPPQIVENMDELNAYAKSAIRKVQGPLYPRAQDATNPGMVYRRDCNAGGKTNKFIQYQQTTDNKFRISWGCCPLDGGLYTNTDLLATTGYGDCVKAYVFRKDAKLCTSDILDQEFYDPKYTKERTIAQKISKSGNAQKAAFAMLRGYDGLVGERYQGGENAIILNRAATITIDPTAANIYVANTGFKKIIKNNTQKDLKTLTQ